MIYNNTYLKRLWNLNSIDILTVPAIFIEYDITVPRELSQEYVTVGINFMSLNFSALPKIKSKGQYLSMILIEVDQKRVLIQTKKPRFNGTAKLGYVVCRHSSPYVTIDSW